MFSSILCSFRWSNFLKWNFFTFPWKSGGWGSNQPRTASRFALLPAGERPMSSNTTSPRTDRGRQWTPGAGTSNNLGTKVEFDVTKISCARGMCRGFTGWVGSSYSYGEIFQGQEHPRHPHRASLASRHFRSVCSLDREIVCYLGFSRTRRPVRANVTPPAGLFQVSQLLPRLPSSHWLFPWLLPIAHLDT